MKQPIPIRNVVHTGSRKIVRFHDRQFLHYPLSAEIIFIRDETMFVYTGCSASHKGKTIKIRLNVLKEKKICY